MDDEYEDIIFNNFKELVSLINLNKIICLLDEKIFSKIRIKDIQVMYYYSL